MHFLRKIKIDVLVFAEQFKKRNNGKRSGIFNERKTLNAQKRKSKIQHQILIKNSLIYNIAINDSFYYCVTDAVSEAFHHTIHFHADCRQHGESRNPKGQGNTYIL